MRIYKYLASLSRLSGAYCSERNNVKKIKYSRAEAFIFPFLLPFFPSSVFFFLFLFSLLFFLVLVWKTQLAASKKFTRTATRAYTWPVKSRDCRQVNQGRKAGVYQTGKRAEGCCVKHTMLHLHSEAR